MKSLQAGIMALVFGATLSSCHHKNLLYDTDLTPEIRVVFDWRNAPEANPESMALILFDQTTGRPLRFIFDNRDGGKISVPYGSYDGLCINSDINQWATVGHEDDIDDYEVGTEEVSSVGASELPAQLLPRSTGSEDERMVNTPGMLWSSRTDGIELPATARTDMTITMYPAEAICHYTVDVTDVENLQYVDGTSVDGVLSGMAESYLHGQNKPTDTHATMPFVLRADHSAGTLHSEFLTFGESSETHYAHHLTVYLLLKDGSKWYRSFDVTDQVHNAADPHHVHIVVSGLTIPEPMLNGGGGFKPDVNDWNDVNVDIKM